MLGTILYVVLILTLVGIWVFACICAYSPQVTSLGMDRARKDAFRYSMFLIVVLTIVRVFELINQSVAAV